MGAVGEALRVNTVPQTLDLSNNDLGEVAGKAVGEALRVNTVLQTLNLSFNRLGEAGDKAVGETLRVNTVLQFPVPQPLRQWPGRGCGQGGGRGGGRGAACQYGAPDPRPLIQSPGRCGGKAVREADSVNTVLQRLFVD